MNRILIVGASRGMGAELARSLRGEARWITGQVLHVDGGLGAVRRFK